MDGDLSLSVGELRRNIKLGKSQVRLQGIRVTDEDAVYIGQDLAAHRGITYLRIERGGLTARGALSIAEGVTRSSLKTCLLGHNEIGDEGALAFAALLVSDCPLPLTKLGLAHNGITNKGAKALCKALEKRPTIAVLDLHDNPVDQSILDAIESTIDKNAGTLV